MLHPLPRLSGRSPAATRLLSPTPRLAPVLALAAAVCLIGGGAASVGDSGAGAAPVRGLGALPLLRAALSAERTLPFEGTERETSVDADVSLLQVRHPADGAVWETAALGTAAAGSIPSGSAAGQVSGEPPMITNAELALLRMHYRLAVTGAATVAGQPAYVVAALRPDGSPAARFWIDQETLLPLGAELVDDSGRTISQVTFVSLATRTRPAGHRHTLPPAGGTVSTTPARLVSAPHARLPGAVRTLGWGRLADVDTLSLVGADLSQPGPVLHLTYSDGVFSLSVFVQHGVMDWTDLSGWQARSVDGVRVWTTGGPLRRVAWQQGTTAVTLVTDAPPSTLDAALAQVTRDLASPAHSPSLLTRLHRGLDRVGSWFNPFS